MTYVPIVQVSIEPIQNGDRPSIEKSHRPVRCPVYMVPLFKEAWKSKGRPTAVVNVSKITDVDDLWLVPEQPGLSSMEGEAQRMRRQFGTRVFDACYRGDEFERAFNEGSRKDNPHELDRQKRDDENREAAVKMAAKGIMQAAGDAAVQSARSKIKRAPRTPEVADA